MIKQLSEIDHVLQQPGMYVGSEKGSTSINEWVMTGSKCEWKEWKCCGIVRKMLEEVISNAFDNAVGNEDATFIDIVFHADFFVVLNDGVQIKVDDAIEDGTNSMYGAFGKLRTSSHYVSEQNAVVGTNGLSVKLSNIFSQKFIVELLDVGGSELAYEWSKNMSACRNIDCSEDLGIGTIKITCFPDQTRVGDFVDLREYSEWIMHCCLESAFGSNLTVRVNDVTLPRRDIAQFVKMHVEEDATVVHIADPMYVCLLNHPPDHDSCISVVNGSRMLDHSIHVDNLLKLLHSNMRKIPLASFLRCVRESVFIYINESVTDPVFSSQSKTKLVGGKLKTHALLKNEETESFLDALEERVEMEMQRRSRKVTRKSGVKVDKLHDALQAGTKNFDKCTLILTEGDSAKTFAMSGLSIVGHDHYGVYPLRGKALNVRDERDERILENSEWKNVMTILGIQLNSTCLSGLRYGGVMILADADLDGIHIAGLIMNFFDSKFHWLLQKYPTFLKVFRTPIVKVGEGAKMVEFFSMHSYNANSAKYGNSKVRYYKGLGSSTREEARNYFSRLDSLQQVCSLDRTEDRMAFRTMFCKKMANERKSLIENHEKAVLQGPEKGVISGKAFVNQELLHFSCYDVARSIASVVDGLKTSQRKILSVCLARGSTIKVAQLASTVALKTLYLHGEHSLAECIVGMAQNYVGSNNVPLLLGSGQFGSRLQGGKDAASPRYIHVENQPFLRSIFHEEDDSLLPCKFEENTKVEPSHYVPIVPMILVNGSRGIATGFSSYVPPFSVLDVISAVECVLNEEDVPELKPFFQGFRGSVTRTADRKYDTKGTYSVKNGEILITELPINSWTESTLAKLQKSKDIVKVVSRCDDINISISVKGDERTVEKMMKSSICLTNMYLLDRNEKLRKFDTVEEIIREFVKVRMEYYSKRKQKILTRLRELHFVNTEKLRFLKLLQSSDNFEEFSKTPRLFLERRSLADDFLKIPISEVCLDRQMKLEEIIATLQKDERTLADQTEKNMYISDLKNLKYFFERV